jgi:hypothetical protein
MANMELYHVGDACDISFRAFKRQRARLIGSSRLRISTPRVPLAHELLAGLKQLTKHHGILRFPLGNFVFDWEGYSSKRPSGGNLLKL